jgi:hypothetical protein
VSKKAFVLRAAVGESVVERQTSKKSCSVTFRTVLPVPALPPSSPMCSVPLRSWVCGLALLEPKMPMLVGMTTCCPSR